MLAGNVVALLSPLIFIPVLTYAFGRQRYDWESMKAIRKGDDSELAADAHVDLELIPGEGNRTQEMEEQEQAKLKKAAIIARSITVFMTLALLVLWPMPMYGSGYIFSKSFFTGKLFFSLHGWADTSKNRMGICRNNLAFLQHSLCGYLPALAGTQDYGTHH